MEILVIVILVVVVAVVNVGWWLRRRRGSADATGVSPAEGKTRQMNDVHREQDS